MTREQGGPRINRRVTRARFALAVLAFLSPTARPVAARTDEAPAPPAVDSVLQGLLAGLHSLRLGSPPEGVAIESLFTVQLTEAAAVQARIVALTGEIDDLSARRAQLEARRMEVVNARSPDAPPPPAPPTAPGADAKPEELRAHDEVVARYDSLLQQSRALAESLAIRATRLEKLNRELALEHEALDQRLAVAVARRDILKQIHARLVAMPAPALKALRGLTETSPAIEERAATVLEVAQSCDQLARRLATLRDATPGDAATLGRAEAGREAPLIEIEAVKTAIDDRRSRLEVIAANLRTLATEQAARGTALRNTALLAFVGPDGQQKVDELFLEHLRAFRRLKRAAGPRVDPVDVRALLESLDALAVPDTSGLLPAPAVAAIEATAVTADLDHYLDLADAETLRWQAGFARDVTTGLEPLISDEMRRHAFALSTELFEEIRAEIEVAGSATLGWLTERRTMLAELPGAIAGGTALSGLVRALLALAMVPLLAVGYRRVPRLVSMVVQRVARTGAGRYRIGVLVRWAGLTQAVLPTLLVMAGGYLIMAFLGTKHVEVRVAEVVFRWLILYLLGRQVLLGLTRRASRNRPALVPVAPETVGLLRLTYRHLGLVIAGAAIVIELCRDYFGLGRVVTLVDLVVALWVLGWAAWAAFAWREPLARALLRREGALALENRAAKWMLARRVGAILAPFAAIWLTLLRLSRLVLLLLSRKGLLAYVRARLLERRSRRANEEPEDAGELPERYLREFPLYPILGEDDALVVDRAAQVNEVLEQVERWRRTQTDSSVVVLGEKGMGKTTLLALLRRRLSGANLIEHTVGRKLRSDRELMQDLSSCFDTKGVADGDQLADALLEGPETVVLLDEAHNVFSRTVDGYRAFDSLVRLVNGSSARVFWIIVFNSFAWEFINASRGRRRYFRRLLHMPAWTVAELQDLVARRNVRSGFEIEFDSVLLDETRHAGNGVGDHGLRLIEGAEGYFRLLWEASRGNPRLATHLWLDSLTPIGPDRLRVNLFRRPDGEALRKLSHELLFALAAFCQHENLSQQELGLVLNVGDAFADFAVNYLLEYGFLESKENAPERYTLAPRWYVDITQTLINKHLLFRGV